MGLHQDSVPSPFLFNIVFDMLTEDVRVRTPWDMMYADDVVSVSESKEGIEHRLDQWRLALERKEMKISRTKTEYMMCTEQEQERRESIRLNGVELRRVDAFKYLGSTLSANGSENKEITERIQAGWKSWRDISGVLCDKKMQVKLKGKVYKTFVRPVMTYRAEAGPVKKINKRRMEVAGMRMLQWICGMTMEDRISNARIRGTMKVGEVSKKTQEARLRGYGHLMRSDGENDEKRALDMEVQRRRGRPKTR